MFKLIITDRAKWKPVHNPWDGTCGHWPAEHNSAGFDKINNGVTIDNLKVAEKQFGNG
jgi:hypothetical protein